MRLLKKHDKINLSKNSERIRPFRSFYLNQDEFDRIEDFKNRNGGKLITNQESEQILRDILEARGMESLLYPELERDDWSGYVTVWEDGMLWML